MAYITTPEVKEIRIALKEKFGKKFKFSVTRRDGGLGLTNLKQITVTVTQILTIAT
jgi:anti-sigma regulatory factor (Ser/Thr protein kinase)